MDPRVKVLIDSVKELHVSLYNDLFWTEFHKLIHTCCACKGNNPIPCAVLRAALELEKEDAEERKVTDSKTSS